jgi:hypothetical protein
MLRRLHCPACRNTFDSEVTFKVDLSRDMIRIWCPFCHVWWSVKIPKEEEIYAF